MNSITVFILSLFAGLSTLFGFLFIFLKSERNRIINFSLSFASGVMFGVSILDLIPESFILFLEMNGKNVSFLYLILSLILGFFFTIFLNNKVDDSDGLYKIGLISMIAIIIHNIPEGIATALTATKNMKLGMKLATAISLHNIPEGVSIAVPIYYATGSKIKAFFMTFISAISEPIGAIFALTFMKPFISNYTMTILFAITAGIMTSISLTELLPNSFNYKEKKKTLFFFVIGIIIMYISVKL